MNHFSSGMESVVATVSGYHGLVRFNLIKLISQTGANYVGAMSKSITHLVCWKFEGNKYNLAKKFNIIVVNHHWVEDCIKQRKRVPEHSYTMKSGQVTSLMLELQSGDKIGLSNENLKPLFECSGVALDRSIFHFFDEDSGLVSWNKSFLLDEHGDTGTNCSNLYIGGMRNMSKKRMLSSNSSLCSTKGKRKISNDIGNSSFESVHKEHMMLRNIGSSKLKSVDQQKMEKNVADFEAGGDSFENSSGVDYQSEKINVDQVELPFNREPSSLELSCVICWTEFSSSRGVLPCGHRFCYPCIQNWSHHMTSRGKISTCPLCKASFASITKMEDAASCDDQKIYSQTVPCASSMTMADMFFFPGGGRHGFSDELSNIQACVECGCHEPEDLLVICHICQVRCIHCYCLDPPLLPWTCTHCKGRQLLCLS